MSALVINNYPVVGKPRKLDKNDNDDLSQFLISIQSLLSKYKMYSKSSTSQVTSGGLQQFITRKLKRKSDQGSMGLSLTQRLRALYSKDESVVLSIDPQSEENCFIQCLPVDLKLYIFSYLDARSLCMACCVNQEWSQLTCDELLWQRLLEKDVKRWSQVSHLSNPRMYQEVDSEWSQKEIYLRCSPEFQRHLRQSNSTFNHVSSVLKYLMPKKVPKVAMFGPGLELSTSGLVRKMLYEDNDTFSRIGMFPGQFDGVGGGMTLKLPTGHSLHLSVLYSASKHERENRIAKERLRLSRLLQQVEQGEAEGAEPEYELKTQIKHLCQTLDAFIFVVDASEPRDSVASSRCELMAMVKERRSAPHVPVLILSCVKQEDTCRIPACDIVESLQLSSLSQPWLVIDCVIDTMSSIDTGIVWLVDQAQLR